MTGTCNESGSIEMEDNGLEVNSVTGEFTVSYDKRADAGHQSDAAGDAFCRELDKLVKLWPHLDDDIQQQILRLAEAEATVPCDN